MDINIKNIISITNEDLVYEKDTTITQMNKNSSGTLGNLLEKVRIPTKDIVLGRINRVDFIPLIKEGIPTWKFDTRSYFDSGFPDEIELFMTLYYKENKEDRSYTIQRIFKDTEFIIDLSTIDKDIKSLEKLDIKIGTKFQNKEDYFYRTCDLKKIESSFYLYDYYIREVPIPAFQLNNISSLPNHLKNKSTKLLETINQFKLPNLNKVPLNKFSERIYIYDIPYFEDGLVESWNSALVPEFQSGLTRYLNKTKFSKIGEEQIFIRTPKLPDDNPGNEYNYYIYMDDNFYNIAIAISSNQLIKKFQSEINRDLSLFVKEIFLRETDIYGIDIGTMKLSFIKYKRLSTSDLNVVYFVPVRCKVQPLNYGAVEYSPPVVNMLGNTQTIIHKTGIFSAGMGSVFYFAKQK